jgi:hypothetical protein
MSPLLAVRQEENALNASAIPFADGAETREHAAPPGASLATATVGWNRLPPARLQLFRGARHHPRQKETGKLIGDHQAGVFRQLAKESFTRAFRRLNVSQITNPARFAITRLRRHALQDGSMQPVVSPRIANAQRLKNHQRLTKPAAMRSARSKAKLYRNRRLAIIQYRT